VESMPFQGNPHRAQLPPPNVEFGARLLADDARILPGFGQQESTLSDTVRILRKRRSVIITAALVMVILATLVSLRMTKKYDATARIAYNKEGGENLGFKDVPGTEENGGGSSDYTVEMETQIKILESDKIALGVIENLHLDQNRVFAGDLAVPPSKAVPLNVEQIDRGREAALLKRFHDATTAQSVRNTRLIQITFRSPDPTLAAAVVNNMVSTYVEDNYRTRYESTMQASDWLAKQISDLQLRVETSQEKLVRYQRENGILGVDEKQNIVTQKLDELNKGLTDAEADRMARQAAYQTARAGKLEQGEESGEASDLVSHLREQEAALRSQYAQLTTTFGPNYPKSLEVKNQIDQTERSIETATQRLIRKLEQNFKSAQAREAMLRTAFEQQKAQANELNMKAIDFSILKRDLDANRTLYEGLLQKLKEAAVTAGLRSSNIRVVDVARVPTGPAVPNWPRNLALSLMIGLVGGVVLSFVIETLENTVQTPEQVQALTGIPSLGLVPESKFLEGGRNVPRLKRSAAPTGALSNQLVAHLRPSSEIAESFRTLRTSILLSSAVQPPRVMMVTSPMPQEGKTTTSINMAVVLAQRGGRVLLIDADLRRPGVHEAFGLSNSAGLSSLLAGLDKYEDVVHGFAPLPNLSIMTAGPIAPNPAELLGSDRMRDLLTKLRTEYDHVILDTPPIIPVTDPAVLSPNVDAVLLVVRSGKTTKSALRHARNLLLQINAPLMGTVVNGANMRSPDYYYRYYYGYKGKGYYHSGEVDKKSPAGQIAG
jgi:succinoglycan biosynthesis transport protein ExoP